jgi:hypothetical protein
MHDGINSDAAVILERFGSDPVACYVNGRFAWSAAQEAMFARKIRVSVMPGQPDAARFARCLDVERGAAGTADVWPFLDRRIELGHSDGTIYTSAANVGQVVAHQNVPRWWIAWYWGQPRPPSALEVINEVERLTGVVLDLGRLWACQWQSAARWDTSIVYGPEDWSR